MDSQKNQKITRYTYTEIHMGGEFRLTFYAPNQEQANTAAKAAYQRIADLEQIMSDYRPSSEVRQIKPQTPTKISGDLYAVLEQAQRISEQTDGAFDITAGPVVKLWRTARQTKRLPGPIELRQALKSVDYKAIQLDKQNQSVTITKLGVAIDLGGIAKGYACDQAIESLKTHQIDQAIVQAGGDIVTSNSPPDSNGWLVQIPGESTPRLFSNCAISTSGDTEQFVEINGTRYSHIVDARTGIGVTNRIMATVIADRGLDTDPLATAFCVLGPNAIPLAKKLGIQLFILENASQPLSKY